MPSDFNIGQYIEWCTDIPVRTDKRDSPTFILKGNEFFLRLVIEEDFIWYLCAYLELKNRHKDLEPCQIKCKIGFKYEENLSLHDANYEISEHLEILSVELDDFHKSLPYDYMSGNLMKFVIFFDHVTEPILKTDQEARNSSSELQSLDPHFCLEHLSSDFSKMLHEGLDHDVEIKCDGQSLRAHKNVLSIRSPVLCAMLNSDMVEGRTRVIPFHDMDVSTVQCFLRYLYCGKLPEMTIEIAIQFYKIGDMYQVECLKKLCANFLMSCLTPENLCGIFKIAVQHSDESFKENLIQFMVDNKVFMNENLWQDFRESNTKEALEVYERFYKANRLLPK